MPAQDNGAASRDLKAKYTIPLPLKAYLITYNVVSAIGWFHLLSIIIIHLSNLDGQSNNFPGQPTSSVPSASPPLVSSIPFVSHSTGLSLTILQLPAYLHPVYARSTGTFARIGVETALVQSFAVLEVVHALLGWVKSPLQTTLAQVSSRLFLVWGVSEQFFVVRVNPLYTTMVLAWSVTEVIRYSFYASSLLGYKPQPLLLLRYTTFYLLYPIGASSEAFLIYATLPSSSTVPGWQSWFRGMWKPVDYLRAALFIIWWPGLYVMYTYMISQRRKVFGPNGNVTPSAVKRD